MGIFQKVRPGLLAFKYRGRADDWLANEPRRFYIPGVEWELSVFGAVCGYVRTVVGMRHPDFCAANHVAILLRPL
jgi:hypothetical protein